MRWARLVVAVLLVLHIMIGLGIVGSQGFARKIATESWHRGDEDGRKEISISTTTTTVGEVGLVGFDCDRCQQTSESHVDCCRFLKNDSNSTTADDDKRVVPTGPNPLHNRR